ncbi:MAG: acyl-CoA desaturase [Gammaproteobacteria bacterium]|nr:acyl-CoA desaturase [Gammaproteobacteria bacterium]
MKTLAVSQPKSPPEIRDGITLLDDNSARLKRVIALTMMIVPFCGFIEAIRLMLIGRFSQTDLWLFTAMYFVHMGGITMGFHRLMAHRTFIAVPGFRALLLIAGSMGAQGPLLDWVATHRRHHAYSDEQGDPHSPNMIGDDFLSKIKGLWYAHMPWMLAKDMSSWSRFARDVLSDRKLFFFHRTYFIWVVAGLALPAVIGGIGGGWQGAWSGFIFGGLARIFVANQFAWAVGSVCHRYGSRPFDTGDNSANNWWVAIMTFGEGLQNNHHAFSSWYRHGVAWWEPDLSGWLLTLFGKLGIVRELRRPSAADVTRMRKPSGDSI